jgi:hypothetical protein
MPCLSEDVAELCRSTVLLRVRISCQLGYFSTIFMLLQLHSIIKEEGQLHEVYQCCENLRDQVYSDLIEQHEAKIQIWDIPKILISQKYFGDRFEVVLLETPSDASMYNSQYSTHRSHAYLQKKKWTCHVMRVYLPQLLTCFSFVVMQRTS